MKTLAVAAAFAATMTVPAFAQDAASFAVMHFNMDQDTANEMRMVPMGDGPVVVDLAAGSTLAEIFGHLNMDADRMSDLRGEGGVTIIMSDPGAAADIFALIMRESRDDE